MRRSRTPRCRNFSKSELLVSKYSPRTGRVLDEVAIRRNGFCNLTGTDPFSRSIWWSRARAGGAPRRSRRRQRGHGRLFLLSGEPGIGKTRLSEETSNDASARGVLVVWGRCWEGEPYHANGVPS
jgi:hypothetical protein